MFGYVRPVRAELKCKDFDLYRAAYCSLCRCLRQRYGVVSTIFLSYDCTFLTLLLWEPEVGMTPCSGRCCANPFLKRPMCEDNEALHRAADVSVILAWWKLQDSIRDDKLPDRTKSRCLSWLMRSSYRKAARNAPEFDHTVRTCLAELSQLEEAGSTSIDQTADAFARLLQSAVPQENAQARVIGQLLYHLGRWIYLADARDDLAEDLSDDRYNPVAARYGKEGDDDALALTMDHSLDQMAAAFHLGSFGCRTPILENIIFLGLPLVQRCVFDGSWTQIKKQKIWRNDR